MQKSASLKEIGTHPWRTTFQQLLVQKSELSTSSNVLQGTEMSNGGDRLGVVVQMVQENGCLNLKRRAMEEEEGYEPKPKVSNP